jgi:threonine synthase
MTAKQLLTDSLTANTQPLSAECTLKGLRCRECGTEYEAKATHVCEFCFGPLEAHYDYEAIARQVTRATIQAGPLSIWRYRPFLPVTSDNLIDLGTGLTPLVRADRLARR